MQINYLLVAIFFCLGCTKKQTQSTLSDNEQLKIPQNTDQQKVILADGTIEWVDTTYAQNVAKDSLQKIMEELESGFLFQQRLKTKEWMEAKRKLLEKEEPKIIDVQTVFAVLNDPYTTVAPVTKSLSHGRINIPIKLSGNILKHKDLNIGFIYLNSFSEGISEDFLKLTMSLIEKGAETLVLDIRWNTGGSLDEAYKIASFFLSNATMGHITSHDNETTSFESSKTATIILPVAVLVNEHTASAGEALASAITVPPVKRDNHSANNRSFLVGNVTYGKGIAQSVIKIDDSVNLFMSSVYISNADNDSWHDLGLVPHYEVVVSEEEKYLILDPAFRGSEKDTAYIKAVETLSIFCSSTLYLCPILRALQVFEKN